MPAESLHIITRSSVGLGLSINSFKIGFRPKLSSALPRTTYSALCRLNKNQQKNPTDKHAIGSVVPSIEAVSINSFHGAMSISWIVFEMIGSIKK